MLVSGPLFALLFAVYPVLHIVVANAGQVGWETAASALAAAAVASALLLATMRPVFRTWARAALAASAVIFLFYAYGPVHTAIEGPVLDVLSETSTRAVQSQKIAAYLHPALSVVWIVAALLGLWAVWRLPDRWVPRIAQSANTMALVLVLLVTVQWVGQKWIGDVEIRPRALQPGRENSLSVLGYNPDIYTIVLDGYAREDVLTQHYQFDNSSFLDGLKARGFQIGDASSANYNWTFLSLASSLNMEYLQTLMGGQLLPHTVSRAAVYDAIRDHAFGRALKQRGYRLVHFQTTWGATLRNPYADEEIACHQGIFTNELYRVIAEASWLKALQPRLTADLAECYSSNLDTLARMGSRPGPKFVFAHFLPPHHPYLFDRHGNVLRGANLSNQFEFQRRLWERKDMYLDQILYMNGRITRVVDDILSTSPRPPIIIIESDHGPNIEGGLSRDETVRIRLANFSAFLLPGAPPGLMPADGSAVNQFRYILNHYFGEQMAILPNRYYFSEYNTPYDMQEVTLRTE
jgi:hypothetical protein